MRSSTTHNRKYTILSTVVLILLWKVLSVIIDKPIVLPSPEETVIALINIVTADIFWLQVGNTLLRVLIGFGISFVSGLILGIISGFFDPFYYLLRPIVLLQRATPTMAIIIMAIIWKREFAAILVGVLVVFPIIYSAVVNGIKNIEPKLLEMSKVYHLSLPKRLRHLYLPSIQSSLISISRATVSLNLKIIIAAEVLSQPNMAIGTGMQLEKATLNMAGVFAWAAIAIVMATGLEMLIDLLFVRHYSK